MAVKTMFVKLLALLVCVNCYALAQEDYEQKSRDYLAQAAKCNTQEDRDCLMKFAQYNQCLLAHKGDVRACERPQCLPVCQETVGGVVNGKKLGVAPFPGWMDWQPLAGGGGCDVQVFYSRSNDDGRNAFELKFKIKNLTNHEVAVRFDATVKSAKGEVKSYKNRGAKINAGRDALGPMTPNLSIGAPFPSAVYQVTPTPIVDLEAVDIEVANLERPLGKPDAATYLSPFRDYEKQVCNPQVMRASTGPRFVQFTKQCADGLPNWTRPTCDNATDELFKAYKTAGSDEDKACIVEWRKYQQCYGAYAFSRNPRPVPVCVAPKCVPHGN